MSERHVLRAGHVLVQQVVRGRAARPRVRGQPADIRARVRAAQRRVRGTCPRGDTTPTRASRGLRRQG